MNNLFDKRSKYSIRKLSVGVASVIVGVSFLSGQTVTADEIVGGTGQDVERSSPVNDAEGEGLTGLEVQDTPSNKNEGEVVEKSLHASDTSHENNAGELRLSNTNNLENPITTSNSKVEGSGIEEETALNHTFSLENDSFKRDFIIENGKLRTVSVTNKITNNSLVFDKESKEFVIQFKKSDNAEEVISDAPGFVSENSDRGKWVLTTSSQQSLDGKEGPVDLAKDNDNSTIWHSRYSNGEGTVRQMPISVTMSFPELKNIGTFIYTPRQNGDNGDIKDYRISVRKDGGDFIEVAKGTLPEFKDRSPKFIEFEKQTGIREIKLEILSSQNNQPFASAAEFDVSSKTVGELAEDYSQRVAEYQKKISEILNRRRITLDKLTVAKDGVKEETTTEGKRITVSFQPYIYNGVPVSIKYVTELRNGAAFSQSHLEISVPKEQENQLQIENLDLQSYKLTGNDKVEDFSKQANIDEMGGFRGFYAGLGQPVYVGSFYTGSEFPIALNKVQDGTLFSRYYSGKTFAQLKKDNQGVYHTWNTVFGVARSDDYQVLQQDFYKYLSIIGQKTYYRKQYNSWFDHMKDITADNIKESFDQIDRGFTRGGVSPLDSYVVDDGWQNVRSLWEFNHKFPNKLYDSSRQTGRFGSNFGLWLGPQGGYGNPGEMADALVKENKGSKHAGVVYIGDKRYVDGLHERFKEYEEKFGINYWKLDGLLLNPKGSSDEHGIGGGYMNMYSMTETHERWIELYETIRKNATDPEKMWINLTSYIPPSPWFLQWVNSIWMQNSGDVDYQDGVKKEKYRHLDFGSDANEALTYRDDRYEELVKLRKWQLPFANIYNHDPVYGNTANSGKALEPHGGQRPKIKFTTDELRTYLYMLGTRGTGFWEFYYSPSMMDDEKWAVNGEAVRWIEDNYETLKHARFHGGKPGHGEVYGYSAWDKEKGILSIRNPINQEQEYTLKLDRLVGMPENIGKLYRKVILGDGRHNTLETLSYGDSITIRLKPYETVIFEYSKNDDKTPANLLGARVTGSKTINLTFDKRLVLDGADFKVGGKNIESQTLNADLRTVTLTLREELKDREVLTVQYQNLKDSTAHANQVSGQVEVIAYSKGRIVDLEIDQKNQTLKNTGQVGRGAFSVTVKATLSKLNQTLAQQGDQWKLSVDNDGRVHFSVKDLEVSSAPYTTLNSDDKGKADELLNVGKEFVVTAMRQANGSLRLYVNGQLHSTSYDKTKVNEELKQDDIVLGEIENFVLENQALDFNEVKSRQSELQPQPENRIVPIKDAIASSFDENDGGPRKAESAIDDDKTTYWASSPDKDNRVDRQMLTLELEKTTKINGVIYTPRQVSDAVGNVKQLYVEVSQDGENWSRAEIVDGESDNTKLLNSGDLNDQFIAIKPLEARFVRMVALRTAHWKSTNLDKVVAAANFKATYEFIPEKLKKKGSDTSSTEIPTTSKGDEQPPVVELLEFEGSVNGVEAATAEENPEFTGSVNGTEGAVHEVPAFEGGVNGVEAVTAEENPEFTGSVNGTEGAIHEVPEFTGGVNGAEAAVHDILEYIPAETSKGEAIVHEVPAFEGGVNSVEAATAEENPEFTGAVNGSEGAVHEVPEFTGGVNGVEAATAEENPEFTGAVNGSEGAVHEVPEFTGGVNGVEAATAEENPEFTGAVNGTEGAVHEVPEFTGGVNCLEAAVHEVPEFSGGVNGEEAATAEEKPEFKGFVNGAEGAVHEHLEFSGGVNGTEAAVHDMPEFIGGIKGEATVHEVPEFSGSVNAVESAKLENPEFVGGVNGVEAAVHDIPEFIGGINGETTVHEVPEFSGSVNAVEAARAESPEFVGGVNGVEAAVHEVPEFKGEQEIVVQAMSQDKTYQAPAAPVIHQQALPETGSEDAATLASVGLVGMLLGMFAMGKKKEY